MIFLFPSKNQTRAREISLCFVYLKSKANILCIKKFAIKHETDILEHYIEEILLKNICGLTWAAGTWEGELAASYSESRQKDAFCDFKKFRIRTNSK